ncbi:MAG: potassium channel family protein [Candidatus Acidiferrales bacterium]
MNFHFAALGGAVIIAAVLWDAFETVVLPRRVSRKFRIAKLFYRSTWRPWTAIARLCPAGKQRELFLSFYGPLSLPLLIGIWVIGLVLGFGILQFDAGGLAVSGDHGASFWSAIYFSSTNFFTLGLGDIVPHSSIGRFLTAVEAGTGFAFLALLIGYLPVIYQSFSKREISISLLDARAGSPPTAGELLRRHSGEPGRVLLTELFQEWEKWSAELLESHLSYPVLAYFRSQHSNQSWIAALTAILDATALVMTGAEGACLRQAELTFAISRHAVVDLAQVFGSPPRKPPRDRLPQESLERLHAFLSAAGYKLNPGQGASDRLRELRSMYEPYVYSLAHFLHQSVPPFLAEGKRKDNWQSSPWEQKPASPTGSSHPNREEDHF